MFIHPDDVASVTVAALTATDHDGATLPITGPTALSFAEMVAVIGNAIGAPTAFEPISDAQQRRYFTEAGESAEAIDYHLSIYAAIRAGLLADTTTGSATCSTGHRSRSTGGSRTT